MSTQKAIHSQLTAYSPGEPFTPASFANLGSRASIDMALMRLARAGTIERLGRGIYVVPKTGPFGIKATPSAERVAEVVAKEENAEIGPNGAEAARRFGFSTQMSTRTIFNTTGPSRKIRYGKNVINLRHVSPRKLSLGNGPAGQALAALWYLGREEVSPSTFSRLRQRLSPSDFNSLRNAKPYMPAWMAGTMLKFEQMELTNGA